MYMYAIIHVFLPSDVSELCFLSKIKKKFFSQMNHDKYFVPYRNILIECRYLTNIY